MPTHDRKTIRFHGKTEPVLETFRVRGRSYYALEKLSRRGAFRVFDPHAGPQGDYRILYKHSDSKATRQSIEILRRLGGPTANRNFPGIVDFARQREDLYVVVAWVSGTNLKQYLQSVRNKKTPRPTASEVVRLTRGLVHGLANYHRRTNIVHGDVSPANLILTSGPTQLVLVDFGSAWPMESAAMREVGDGVTEPYAAPERIARHAAEDFRSDAFSVAAVAYELLTLAIPYSGLGGRAGTPSLVGKISGAYEEPSKSLHRAILTRNTLKLLDDCLSTGLALDPDDRFATTSDWIGAWDNLYYATKKGTRLNRFESFVADRIAAVFNAFQKDSEK